MTLDEANMTIDYLKEMQEGYIEGEGYERHPLPEWYALEKAIQTIEQTTWIPVGEKLPEEREWCLAVFKEKDTGYQLIPRVADYIGKSENKWQIIDEYGLRREYRDKLECIAWMPLPQPYKGESEDK